MSMSNIVDFWQFSPSLTFSIFFPTVRQSCQASLYHSTCLFGSCLLLHRPPGPVWHHRGQWDHGGAGPNQQLGGHAPTPGQHGGGHQQQRAANHHRGPGQFPSAPCPLSVPSGPISPHSHNCHHSNTVFTAANLWALGNISSQSIL